MIAELARDGRVTITAKKGSKKRVIELTTDEERLAWRRLHSCYHLTLVSYDVVLSQIKAACRINNIGLPDGAHDGTHIFRHLRASWRADEGWPIERIQAELGHVSPGSTEQYIHDVAKLVMS